LNLIEDNLPEYIQFNIVMDNFSCSNGRLTTMRGFPNSVGNFFACHNNKITSFDFFPKMIGSSCYIHDNPIADISRESEIRDELRRKFKIYGQIVVKSRSFMNFQ